MDIEFKYIGLKKKKNYVSLVLDDMHMHGITIYFYKRNIRKSLLNIHLY